MKKDLTIMTILTIVLFVVGIYIGASMQRNSFLERSKHLAEKEFFTNRDIEHILFNEPLPMLKDYVTELQNEGWSKEAGENIAKVEMGFLPSDEEYISYMND